MSKVRNIKKNFSYGAMVIKFVYRKPGRVGDDMIYFWVDKNRKWWYGMLDLETDQELERWGPFDTYRMAVDDWGFDK